MNLTRLDEAQIHIGSAMEQAALAERALKPVATDMSGGRAVYPDAAVRAAAHAQLAMAHATIAAVALELAKL